MTVDSSTTEGVTQEPIPAAETDTPQPADTSVSDAKATPADSSTADGGEPQSSQEGDKKPTSVLEAVEAALKPDKPAAESPTAKTGKKDQKDDSETEADKDVAEVADEDLPFHKHPRWKAVVAERDEYKAKAAEYESANEAITRLETFMTAQNLTVDELNTAMQIGAWMRNDPQKALEALTPYVRDLLQIAGATLPADLQQAVDEGTISENYAKELAGARSKSVLSQQRIEQTEQRFNQQQTRQHTAALSASASNWERQWSASDPDYAKKAGLVHQTLKLRWLEGDTPRTEQAMIAQCEEVKKAVEAQLRGLMPKKQPASPGPQTGSAGNTQSAAAPKSMLDVINSVVGG